MSNQRRRIRKKEPVVYQLDIIGWDLNEIRGVARHDGKVIFVEGALPGEVVMAERLRSNKNFEEAYAFEVLKKSSLRTEPMCPHFRLCGGCSLQHMNLGAQVAVKQRLLEEQYQNITSIKPERILPPIVGPQWHYRDRARMSAKYVNNKGMLLGFRERKSGYVANMDSCPIMPKHISDLIAPLRELMGQMDARHTIPQIEWSYGKNVTVMAVRHMEPLSEHDFNLFCRFIDEKSTSHYPFELWLQPGKEDTLHRAYTPNQEPIDLTYSIDEFHLQMLYTPVEFTQVNRYINQSMISRALRLLELKDGDRVLDLFCGLGNFTLPILKLGYKAIGYEGSKDLVNKAYLNAKRNGLEKDAEFYEANLFKADEIPYEEMSKCNKWVIDPPRDGAFELVKTMDATKGPERIVYISCKPATLARDAKELVQKGYRLEQSGIMNMFPNTTHTEAIALFVKV